MLEIKSANIESELLGILELQQLNLRNHVSIEERKTDGFVTIKHSLELLQKMSSFEKQIIAIEDQKIVGFALTMVQEVKNSIPVLEPMFRIFNEIKYNSKYVSEYNYYVMGQICISKSHRGQGLFRKLYSKHQSEFASKYDLCVTEVSDNNPRSLGAHLKLALKLSKNIQTKPIHGMY